MFAAAESEAAEAIGRYEEAANSGFGFRIINF